MTMQEKRQAMQDATRSAEGAIARSPRKERFLLTYISCIVRKMKANSLGYEKMRTMTALMHESIRVKRQPRGKLTAKGLTEIGASLTDIDWRLLHWLLHYPLNAGRAISTCCQF
jgi:hypothetical protein